LEALTGHKISDDKLKKAIDSLNQIRSRLKKISLLRKEQPPPIGGYDFIRLNHYSFYGEPEVLAEKLDGLYRQLQKTQSPFPREAPRLLLAGHVVSVGDYVVPKLIEDSGAVIVAEFLDEGMRHYNCNVETSGDLMGKLGDAYYLKRTPPSVFQPAWEARVEAIKRLVKEFSVDGVIWYQLTFEEVYDMECAIVARAMETMKIPFLKLESSYEYAREAMGPLTTRVESFIESVKQRRG
jgi:benzoyl-CoA reductase/2-hydroxyglutaryl-CoA dehydratase subunit BcrC/BadD/HgdB